MQEETETLDDLLGYDADHTDSRQFCRHGTFIGSWWGPDYMCGACEMGITDREYVIGTVHQQIRRQQEAIKRIFPFQDDTMHILKGMPYSHSFTTFLMDQVDRHYDELAGRLADIAELEPYLATLEANEDEAFFATVLKAWRG